MNLELSTTRAELFVCNWEVVTDRPDWCVPFLEGHLEALLSKLRPPEPWALPATGENFSEYFKSAEFSVHDVFDN